MVATIVKVDIVPPQEPVANVQYRKRLREWAVARPANREWIMRKCRDDFYFWLESFAWLYEPRPEPGRSPILPFIPWPHQRPVMDAILHNLGYRDIGIEKARGEGATWLCLMILLWRWIFHPMQAIGIVSRNEMTADNPDDPDSLGAKVDWALAKMPEWMVGVKGVNYRRNISKHTWINLRNESTMTAYPSTGDLASGGRKTVFFMDELSKFPRGDDEDALAATEPVTNCRLLVSTYNGADGAYYRAMNDESTKKLGMVKCRLKWTDNPYRSVNKFCIDGKNSRLVDPDTRETVQYLVDSGYSKEFFEEVYPVLVKRGFCVEKNKRMTQKVWSPWYVERCMRARMTPQKVAQEYDMDPIGSGNRFFPKELLDTCLEYCKPPTFSGDIEYDLEHLKITRIFRSATGLFRTWLPVDDKGFRPPPAPYVVGADVAQGLGTNHSSNSAIAVLNRETGEKVAEFASPTVMPEKLAEIAIALCRFFTQHGNPAYLIWEANGPGGAFRERIMSTPFRNFYYRSAYKTRRGKPSKEPGWWSSAGAKQDLLGKYRWALQEGYFANPSEVAVREAGQYVTVGGGRLEYLSGGADKDDPSDAGENHGDRVIADAVANYAMEYLGGGATQAEKTEHERKNPKPQKGSFAYRQQEARRQQRKREDDW